MRYKSKESLGASVAKEMCFQGLSKRIEGKSRPSKPGWKVVPQSRTGSRETPVAKFVVCSWHKQLPNLGVLQERVYQQRVRDVDELSRRLIDCSTDMQQTITDDANDDWRAIGGVVNFPAI